MSFEKQRITKKHICGFCKNEFTKKTSFDKHILYCEKISNSKHILKIDEEEEKGRPLPSIYTLSILVEQLIKDNDTMKKEIRKLKDEVKQLTKKKEKINIVDWLNSPSVKNPPKDLFQELEDYCINREDMLYIIEHNYVDGIYNILQKILAIDKTEEHPIRCYNEFQNIFYIYIKEFDIYKWVQLREEDFKNILKILNRKLWLLFDEYRKENIKQINKSEKLHEKFCIYRTKITGSTGYNKTYISNIKPIQSILYKYLKRKTTSITEYEFTY